MTWKDCVNQETAAASVEETAATDRAVWKTLIKRLASSQKGQPDAKKRSKVSTYVNDIVYQLVYKLVYNSASNQVHLKVPQLLYNAYSFHRVFIYGKQFSVVYNEECREA